MNKKLKVLLLAMSLLVSNQIIAKDIQVTINGKEIEVAPILKDGVTFVPLRFIAENLGAVVRAHDNGVDIIKLGTILHLEIGKREVQKGDQIIVLSYPPIVINNRIYVPLRFVGEALGCTINYDEKSGMITIVDANSRAFVDKGLGNGVEYIPSTNTTGQTATSGYFVQEGEWLYYSNVSQNGKLYRCKKNFTEKELVSEDEYVEYINFCGNLMYYVSRDDFVVQNRDGSNKVKINTRDGGYSMSYPYVIGNWVYYIDNPQMGFLIRMKLDGSDKQQLSSERNVSSFTTDGTNIYYSTNTGKIFKIDVAGNTTKLTIGTGFGRVWDYKDGKLYVTADNYLYQSTDELKTKLVVGGLGVDKDQSETPMYWNDRFSIYSLQEDWMYYVNPEDKQSIYRYNIVTKERQKLNDVKSEDLYVTSDRVYYRNMYTNNWEQVELDT